MFYESSEGGLVILLSWQVIVYLHILLFKLKFKICVPSTVLLFANTWGAVEAWVFDIMTKLYIYISRDVV